MVTFYLDDHSSSTDTLYNFSRMIAYENEHFNDSIISIATLLMPPEQSHIDVYQIANNLLISTRLILILRGLIRSNISLYPVHGANLTLIQPMWSAYPYAPTSLYGIHMPLLPYMVIQPIVLGMALLWAAIDSALSQGPLLWRHNDMTVIVSRNTRGRERDTRQRLDNANARRL